MYSGQGMYGSQGMYGYPSAYGSPRMYLINGVMAEGGGRGRGRGRGNQQPVYPYPYNSQNLYGQPESNQVSPKNGPQPKITVIDGILIVNEYEPQKGDPVVIEQAEFKGTVVKVDNKEKQAVNENETVLVGEGYASEDGKLWKRIPKIVMSVFKVGQLEIKDITKIKARYQSSLPHIKVIKITCVNKEYYLSFKEKDFNQWFLRLVWARLTIGKKECSEFGDWGTEVTGKIYKKSQILKEWQPRLVVIDSRSLRSSKENNSSPSLQISGTKQIWTRFQQIQGGCYFVVKLWYGIIKTEFAVPTAFCIKWLYHFLRLLTVS